MKQETLQSLCERRSIRKYKPEQIKEEELTPVLRAGVYAPTGKGRQSPLIVVVQKKETRDLLSRLNAQVLGSDSDPFYGAPTILVVFADSSCNTYLEDGSLVIGNLLNAAYAVGLASCWIHRAREVFALPEGKALMKKWGIPDRYVGIGHCILGYADMPLPKPAARKKDYILYD